MKIRSVLIALLLLPLLAPLDAAQAQTKPRRKLQEVDWVKYFELLPEMKEISEKSMESVRTLNKLIKELEATADDAEAAKLRAQIREVLVAHRKLKLRMIDLNSAVLKIKPPPMTDVEALRLLRGTQLQRPAWNGQFLKYVSRDISQAIGVPIRLNSSVQELNEVELSFPEIGAEALLDLICKNFFLKWIIFRGRIIIFRKINPNEARFKDYESRHGKVDWIAEDEAMTYDTKTMKPEKREKVRKLQKLEDMDLPYLEQQLTKIYILEGESGKHELRLKNLELAAKMKEHMGFVAKTPEEKDDEWKRHRDVIHYQYMEHDNAVEVWDIINHVLGEALVLPEQDEELKALLATELPVIDWRNIDIEEALYSLGKMAGVEVELDKPPDLQMKIKLYVENANLEMVINLICTYQPLDWRYVNGRLFFGHTDKGLGKDD